MDTLVQFLRDRLDDDERIAQETLNLNERAQLRSGQTPPRWYFGEDGKVWTKGGVLVVQHTWAAEGAHISRHDPTRVLLDVQAKRSLLTLYAEQGDDTVLRLLAVPYSDHPAWKPEWRPA